MAADNSLGRFVDMDLAEMKEGLLLGNYNHAHLLVYIDKGDGNTRLVELKKKGKTVDEMVVQEYQDRNSVGVEETKEVFKDVFNRPEYRAGSYGLVYWSHGDGWIPNPLPESRWIGQDTGEGTHYMNINDLEQVLKQAPHFDFIMFDACFMQSIEVAYELRQYADYFIASPAETPGPGAPYTEIMPYLLKNNAAVELAAAYFAAYEAKYEEGRGLSNTNWTAGAAISVLKSSALENLATATKQALKGTTADAQSLRGTIFNCDPRDDFMVENIGYFDFVELMQAIVQDKAKLQAWYQAFTDAQCYWKTTPKLYSAFIGMFSMERSHGMTHYIPALKEQPQAARAYRTMAWYTAAGLSELKW